MLNEKLQRYRTDSAYSFAVLYRHWPLERHRFAEPAARASECAGIQGRFEQMHDSLFSMQAKLGVIPWSELASGAGVKDLRAFEQCMASDSVPGSILADAIAAKRLGARGTPAVVVSGGSQFVGVPSKTVLDSLLASKKTANDKN
jgi:protein-disulfide isomerase